MARSGGTSGPQGAPGLLSARRPATAPGPAQSLAGQSRFRRRPSTCPTSQQRRLLLRCLPGHWWPLRTATASSLLSSLSLSALRLFFLSRNPLLPVIYFGSTSDKFSPVPLFYVLCRISRALECFASFSHDVFYEVLIMIVYYYHALSVCLGPSEPLSEQFINNAIFIITIICLSFSHSPHLPSAPFLFSRPVC